MIVAGCVEGNCKYNSGNYQARRCVNEVKDILEEVGVSSERLAILNLAANQTIDLVNIYTQMRKSSAGWDLLISWGLKNDHCGKKTTCRNYRHDRRQS